MPNLRSTLGLPAFIDKLTNMIGNHVPYPTILLGRVYFFLLLHSVWDGQKSQIIVQVDNVTYPKVGSYPTSSLCC